MAVRQFSFSKKTTTTFEFLVVALFVFQFPLMVVSENITSATNATSLINVTTSLKEISSTILVTPTKEITTTTTVTTPIKKTTIITAATTIISTFSNETFDPKVFQKEYADSIMDVLKDDPQKPYLSTIDSTGLYLFEIKLFNTLFLET